MICVRISVSRKSTYFGIRTIESNNMFCYHNTWFQGIFFFPTLIIILCRRFIHIIILYIVCCVAPHDMAVKLFRALSLHSHSCIELDRLLVINVINLNIITITPDVLKIINVINDY